MSQVIGILPRGKHEVVYLKTTATYGSIDN